MNADNFTQYLEDPSLLYQASYQELKSLAMQYPYCQNLHLLLFQKSYMDGSGEWEQNLEKAAVYSIDRRHLFHQARKLDKKTEEAEAFLLSEDFLELKSLETLQPEPELLPEKDAEVEKEGHLQLEFIRGHQQPSSDKEPQNTVSPQEEEEEEDGLFHASAGIAPKEENEPYSKASVLEEEAGSQPAEPATDGPAHLPIEEPQPAAPGFKPAGELIDDCTSLLPIIEALQAGMAGSARKKEKKAKSRPPLPSPHLAVLNQKTHYRPLFYIDSVPEEPAEAPKPQPKQSFTSWVEQFQSPVVQGRLSELMESKKMEEFKKKRKKKKKSKRASEDNSPAVGRLALRSITENKEILSETLAELLVRQGESGRAIEMYQALMLVFPQKSDYFAEKIENLKSK